ncbi:hypothetical protein KW797_00195 [Candidatus Parcubacteria bacterium]|nr:hypothetical protein [Candidatus Parcubacteria bacterium]
MKHHFAVTLTIPDVDDHAQGFIPENWVISRLSAPDRSMKNRARLPDQAAPPPNPAAVVHDVIDAGDVPLESVPKSVRASLKELLASLDALETMPALKYGQAERDALREHMKNALGALLCASRALNI